MKVPDEVIRTRDLGLIEGFENIQLILNQGLYEMRTGSEIPTWAANDGETFLYLNDSADERRLYFRANGIWTFIGWTSTGSLFLVDADGDTFITPEFTADEDTIRFYAQGIYQVAINTLGLCLPTNTPVCFDGTDGTSKWLFDSASTYMRGYNEGVLRVEF